ncbi:MAG: hypothetical protein P1V97_16900 [Planctomycetota bacterium]|nr:hypothetical protein [Planctomycetota bacterium]
MTALRTLLNDSQGRFEELAKKKIFLSTGILSQGLGLLGYSKAGHEEAAQFFEDRGCSPADLSLLLDVLEDETCPQVIHLGTLIGILGASWTRDDLGDVLRNARISVYGTDGSRGEVGAKDCDPEEGLLRKLRDSEMTPRFFRMLVAATIRCLRNRGLSISHVPVGWDTRDLFASEGKEGLFRKAIVEGVLDTGADALVMGITPIAVSSYILAALQGDYDNVTLSFNKTASHNPPSHDGLKSFCVDCDRDGVLRVRKLQPLEESEMTAYLFSEAVFGEDHSERGNELDIRERAEDLLREIFSDHENRGTVPGELWQSFALVYDGSNGAAANPNMVSVLREVFGSQSTAACHFEFLSCEPNGRNINDHCGAGALEGCEELAEAEIMARFGDFASIQAVWGKGRSRREQSKKDGRLAFGLATDGDSDRSYVFFYDPFRDTLRFLDGDASILLQVQDGLDRGTLTEGLAVAFTIESAATFAEELIKRARATVKSSFALYGQERDPETLQFVMTPVGDKWVLNIGPAIGGEATGHIIRPVEVKDSSGRCHEVHAGNGPLGLITTLAAFERRIMGLSGEPLELALNELANPYPKGVSLTTYVYFVERGRFYKDGRVWDRLKELLEACLDEHAGQHQREISTFEDDPNTLLIVLRSGPEVLCSLHVRCSGTEAKIGLKASAAELPEFTALFNALDDEIFFLLAETLRDSTSVYWQRQRVILSELLGAPQEWTELEKKLAESGESGALFQSQNRFLRSALSKQRLVMVNEKRLSLTDRGQRYAKALEDWT